MKQKKGFKIVNLVVSSFRCVTAHWKLLLLSILVDFLFLLVLGGFSTIIQLNVLDHLQAVMQMAGEQTGGLLNIYNETAEVSTGMMGLTQSAEFQQHMNSIFKWLLLLVLISYISWIIFQGISWFLAHRMSSGKKQGFWQFYRNFALETIPFYLMTVVLVFLSVKMMLSLKMSITPFVSENTLNIIFAILAIITWYFGTLCYTINTKYAYMNFKQSLIYGAKKFLYVIQSVVFIIISVIIINSILSIGYLADHPFVLILLGILIFLPAVTFARILLLKTTQEYWIGGKD